MMCGMIGVGGGCTECFAGMENGGSFRSSCADWADDGWLTWRRRFGR